MCNTSPPLSRMTRVLGLETDVEENTHPFAKDDDVPMGHLSRRKCMRDRAR